jgi:hypothetical protein
MSPPRNDIETTTPARPSCPVCGARFTRNRRQRYCSSTCRQAAWRTRHTPTAVTPPDDGPRPSQRPRRQITVYACTECEQRYLAQQWCPDCQRPCRRVDLGGLCPHCDEPIAIIDLLDQHLPPSTHQT